jgi:hypothetical protein
MKLRKLFNSIFHFHCPKCKEPIFLDMEKEQVEIEVKNGKK